MKISKELQTEYKRLTRLNKAMIKAVLNFNDFDSYVLSIKDSLERIEQIKKGVK
jgi:hypothetical protein